MVRNSKQSWEVDSVVRVGFLTLTVRAVAGTEYLLSSQDGTKLYAFEPYTGTPSITVAEGQALMANATANAARTAAAVIAKAAEVRAVDALFAVVA